MNTRRTFPTPDRDGGCNGQDAQQCVNTACDTGLTDAVNPASVTKDLNRAKVLFQMRGLVAAMGIDPDTVRIATDDNAVRATIDAESDPHSWEDALASPSCFIEILPSNHGDIYVRKPE